MNNFILDVKKSDIFFYIRLALSLCTFLVYMCFRCYILRRKLSHYHHRATLFCKNLMLNWKLKTWKSSFIRLTTFSKWAVVQQLHVVTSRFVLQYILTFEVNILKYQPIIYFDKTNVKLIDCSVFEWNENTIRFTVMFSSNMHCWVYTL